MLPEHYWRAAAALPLAMMMLVVGIASNEPVCLPAELKYGHTAGCTACSNQKHVVQTISEMVARNDTTAEAFTAVAALTVIGLAFIIEQVCDRLKKSSADTRPICYALRVSVFVSACGMIGLTVWSLRVDSRLHSCFTALTICTMLVQLCLCFDNLHEAGIVSRNVSLGFTVPAFIAAVLYVVLYASRNSTDPTIASVDCDEYFDIKHYKHAVAQCSFITLYFCAMCYISHAAATHKDTYEKLASV